MYTLESHYFKSRRSSVEECIQSFYYGDEVWMFEVVKLFTECHYRQHISNGEFNFVLSRIYTYSISFSFRQSLLRREPCDRRSERDSPKALCLQIFKL